MAHFLRSSVVTFYEGTNLVFQAPYLNHFSSLILPFARLTSIWTVLFFGSRFVRAQAKQRHWTSKQWFTNHKPPPQLYIDRKFQIWVWCPGFFSYHPITLNPWNALQHHQRQTTNFLFCPSTFENQSVTTLPPPLRSVSNFPDITTTKTKKKC